MDLFVDRRPIFTIGQIWFDFAKRLPRDYPRYQRPEMNAEDLKAYQALSAAQMSALQSQLSQPYSPYGQPRQPYWGPIGSGLGDFFFHP